MRVSREEGECGTVGRRSKATDPCQARAEGHGEGQGCRGARSHLSKCRWGHSGKSLRGGGLVEARCHKAQLGDLGAGEKRERRSDRVCTMPRGVIGGRGFLHCGGQGLRPHGIRDDGFQAETSL